QAIRFGNMLFVSGQGPLDPETKQVVQGEIEVQTRRTLANLRSVLSAAGADFANVVNMRVILRDVRDFKRFNEVFREEIGQEKVTRTCVGGTP
ncbi:Rid family hydrolase, partial [Acinetobacter baumannii]